MNDQRIPRVSDDEWSEVSGPYSHPTEYRTADTRTPLSNVPESKAFPFLKSEAAGQNKQRKIPKAPPKTSSYLPVILGAAVVLALLVVR